ncbi:MAG: 30S ribosome-binding factor RbfA [Enterobacterales bacterium]
MQKFNRINKISSLLRKEISIILQSKINTPQTKMFTISGIKLSNDFSYAKIFVTFLYDSNEEIKNNIFFLKNMSKFIRKLLSMKLKLRKIPKLTFIYDDSIQQGWKISNLLLKVIKNSK